MSLPPPNVAGSPDFDSLIDRFEAAWREGRRPAIEDALSGAADVERPRLLVELMHAELEFRLKAGEAARVEDYLRRFPDLAGRPADLCGLIVAEHRCRLRREPDLSWAEYRVRFPEHQADLDRLAAEQSTRPEAPPGPATRTAGEAGWPAAPGYEILGVLGKGGMGVVYKARQLGLNRVVALKMILADEADDAQMARFRAEAETIARLRHPHIVQIHEVGEYAGRPFFSLEFMEGGSLADKLKTAPFAPAAAAELTETLARAVHAAHRAGVVHRDLKPGNVLLAEDGTPKVADFGLAKKLDAAASQPGAVVGTPGYMPPEQAAGRQAEVGPAADVYGLGAVLYELLTGRPPFRGPSPLDTLLQVLRDEPPPPRRLQPGVPRDLETICLKCLEKKPARRYASALDLAEDLRRFRAGEPVRARPVGAAERVWKWARRRPTQAALLAVGLLALVAASAGGVGAFDYANLSDANDRLNSANGQLNSANGKLNEVNGELNDANGKLASALDEAKTQRARADQLTYAAHVNLAQRMWQEGGFHAARALLLQHEKETDLHGLEWDFARRLCFPGRRLRLTIKDHPAERTALAYSPDGRRLAFSGGKVVRVRDAETGRELYTLVGHSGAVHGVRFSPDGRRLATASADRTVRLWDAEDGKELAVMYGHHDLVSDVAFHPDGTRLASASRDGTIRIWDLDTSKSLFSLEPDAESALAVAFSPDGKRVVSGHGEGAVVLWDAENGVEKSRLTYGDTVFSVAFSPDGRRLAAGGSLGKVKVWYVESDALPREFGASDGVSRVAFSPDGRRLAAASFDRTAKVWDLAAGAELVSIDGDEGIFESIAFHPDGDRLATGHRDGAVQVWDVDAPDRPLTFRGGSNLLDVAFSPDGRRVTDGGSDGDYQVKIWDIAEGSSVTLAGHTDVVAGTAFDPDGRRVVTASTDKTARVWDAETGRELTVFRGHEDAVIRAAFSPDGRRVATGSSDATARIWDPETGRVLRVLKHPAAADGVAFHPDGRRLATACADGVVRIWDLDGDREPVALTGHTGPVQRVCFRPDGRRLASSSEDGTVRVWDVETGRELLTLAGHFSAVFGVAYSADGRRIASASIGKRKVILWDADTGQDLFTVSDDRFLAWGVALSSDGRRLALTAMDGVEVWEAEPSAEDGPSNRLAHRRRDAAECERVGDAFGAAFHLTRLIAADPTDGLLRQRRAAAYTRLGRWREAAVEWAEAALVRARAAEGTGASR